MNKRGIYKITNPKGKIYIGQSINIEKRKKDYEFLNCKKQYKILNSIKKYGWDKHSFELIEECSLEQLNERERYWQDFYNVLVDGLNLKLTQTNDKSGKHSNETIQKLKNYWSDYYTSNNGHNLGKKQSKETCLKKSKSAPSQPILQYDLDNNLIKEWPSTKIASLELKIDNGQICSVCKGKGKSAGGYIWKYK
jgi:group I intron endonuclease